METHTVKNVVGVMTIASYLKYNLTNKTNLFLLSKLTGRSGHIRGRIVDLSLVTVTLLDVWRRLLQLLHTGAVASPTVSQQRNVISGSRGFQTVSHPSEPGEHGRTTVTSKYRSQGFY